MNLISFIQKKVRNAFVKLDMFISEKYFKSFEADANLLKKESIPFLNTSVEGFPGEAVHSLNFYNRIGQTEYAYLLEGNFFIEPKSGWILNQSKNKYFKYSVPYKELAVMPSFYRIKLKKYKVLKFKKVINLRYYFYNYWHFFNDVLGQLALIDTIENDAATPILIPAKALSISYVRDAINSSSNLRSRNWIEHDENVMIAAEQILTVKNLPNTKANFLNILRLLELNNLPSTGTAVTGRKIFMKRACTIKRALSNTKEIEELMLLHDFEIVDNDLLSFEEQVSIYQNAEIVIGIHGAGLANLMFRYPLSLHFVELFPADNIPPHYYWLCNELGFKYDCIVGNEMIDNKFYLPVEKLLPYLN